MIDITKVINWPLIVLICFVFFCIFFRKQIVLLLNRTTSVGKDGLKTSLATVQSSREIDKLKQPQEELLADVLASPTLKGREKLIRKELKEKGMDDTGDTVKVLIRYLAMAQLIVNFQEIYRIIYGSQISLLGIANENRAKGISIGIVKTHFVTFQQMFKPIFDQWEVDTYMQFLLSSNLVNKEAQVYRITEFGVEFLDWLVKTGLPDKTGFY